MLRSAELRTVCCELLGAMGVKSFAAGHGSADLCRRSPRFLGFCAVRARSKRVQVVRNKGILRACAFTAVNHAGLDLVWGSARHLFDVA